jgi:hypothetical protein
LFFFLGLVLFGWFLLTRFQVLLQQKKEDQSLFFGLLGKHLGHAQSSYQSTEKRLDNSAGDFWPPTRIPSLSKFAHTNARQGSQSIRDSEDVLICG